MIITEFIQKLLSIFYAYINVCLNRTTLHGRGLSKSRILKSGGPKSGRKNPKITKSGQKFGRKL